MNEPGTFYWNELNTHDPEKAKAFYGKLFGWHFEEVPMPGDEPPYCLARKEGLDFPVGGIFTMKGPDFENIPEHWMSYLSVSDINEAVETAAAAGGKIIRPPFEVPGSTDKGNDKIAILFDAQGGVFGLVQTAA